MRHSELICLCLHTVLLGFGWNVPGLQHQIEECWFFHEIQEWEILLTSLVFNFTHQHFVILGPLTLLFSISFPWRWQWKMLFILECVYLLLVSRNDCFLVSWSCHYAELILEHFQRYFLESFLRWKKYVNCRWGQWYLPLFQPVF